MNFPLKSNRFLPNDSIKYTFINFRDCPIIFTGLIFG